MKEKTETSVVGRWLQDINEMEEDAAKRWGSNLNALQRAINTFNKNFMNHVDRVRSESEALGAHVWGTQAERNAWHERFKA